MFCLTSHLLIKKLFAHSLICLEWPSLLSCCWLGGRKGIRPVKNMEWWGAGVVICLEWGEMICIWFSWCHCHPIISCFRRIQNGLSFWYWPTQVVLEKRPLNGCVCLCVSVICLEAFTCLPSLLDCQVLGVYTFTKRVNLDDGEAKPRRAQGYSTVSHFNVIHIECHLAAVRYDLPRSLDRLIDDRRLSTSWSWSGFMIRSLASPHLKVSVRVRMGENQHGSACRQVSSFICFYLCHFWWG